MMPNGNIRTSEEKKAGIEVGFLERGKHVIFALFRLQPSAKFCNVLFKLSYIAQSLCFVTTLFGGAIKLNTGL